MKNKKVTVLYIITKLELGGAQKVCLSLFKGLNENGEEGLLISGSEGPLTEEVKENPSVFLLPEFKREVSIKSLFQEAKAFFTLIRHIKKLKQKNPQLIIHTHSTKAGLMGRWAAFLVGAKQRIHTVHGWGFHSFQNRLGWFINFILEFITSLITSHYVCVSSSDVKAGVKFFPRFSKKHSIIRAAIEWDKFYQPARKIEMEQFTKKISNDIPKTVVPAEKSSELGKQFIFGTVACFKKQKNLFDLLKAFKQAWQKNNHLYLEIIGDGHLRPKLQKWIKNHKLKSHITLLGWQAHVENFMPKWNAFVLSSLWEGLPCSVVEARLQKLPVISYNTGGIHDVIMQGENGILVKPCDWQALSDEMLKLSIDKALCTKLSNCNEDLTEFQNSYMVERHLELYRSLQS